MWQLLKSIPLRTYVLMLALLILVQGVALYALGQPLISTDGTVKLWHGVVQSSGNSQHLADWYTFSHIIHGFAFFGAVWLLSRGKWPAGLMLVVAIIPEIVWEIVENTPLIIDRYRAATISWGYSGDSVINSAFDTLAAVAGYLLASRLSFWVIIAIAIGLELFVGYLIRDNLGLNILMLISPLESVRDWQAGL